MPPRRPSAVRAGVDLPNSRCAGVRGVRWPPASRARRRRLHPRAHTRHTRHTRTAAAWPDRHRWRAVAPSAAVMLCCTETSSPAADRHSADRPSADRLTLASGLRRQAAHAETASSSISRPRCESSYRTAKSSTACARPRSRSRAGGWRRHDTSVRPHASLGLRSPAPEVVLPAFTAWRPALRRSAPPTTQAVAPRPTLEQHSPREGKEAVERTSMSASHATRAAATAVPVVEFDAIVVGAGMSGMYQLIRLRGLGRGCGSSKPAPASAAPGTGSAIRGRASTPRATPTASPSPRSCRGSGAGWSISRRSRTRCGTSTTSPTASTCAATSDSAAAPPRRIGGRRRGAGP